jgi:hypothetical protein
MQKRIIALLGTMLIVSTELSIAEPPSLYMDDFAYGAPLTSAASEFRSFTLLPTMIKDVKRRDLGDIRVFDGNSELIPTLVRKKDGQIKISRQSVSFSRLQIAGKTTGYMLDRTAKHEQSLKSLSLKWKQGTAPSVLSIRVEHSPNKKSWKTLKDSETVNNFKFNGIALNQNIIDINNNTQRYIKLIFLDKKQAPALASVHAYVTNKKISDYFWISAGKLQPQEGMPNSYGINLNKGIRPKLIKLSFPKLNSIISGPLNSIETINGKSQIKPLLKNFSAYIVTMNNKVVKSRPINISRWKSSNWLITSKASKNIQPEDLPGITAAYPQYEVIFASNGNEPYTVVWGNAAAGAPMAGNIIKRIKTQQDIAVVKPGSILNNTDLTELMESRQVPWLMLLTGLFIAIAAAVSFVFGYQRYLSNIK